MDLIRFCPAAGRPGFRGLSSWVVSFALCVSVLTQGDAIAVDDGGSSQVLCGIDALERDGFKLLEGKRVGLITNQTGINVDGVTTIDVLHKSPTVNLVALFSPEHGLAGKLDVAKINDTEDEGTGLRVFSLYGKTRTPTDESLKEIDVLVFDIQDVGARFYTYISTMGNAMKAAAKNGIAFVVLDRPNPINGVDVDGPVLDEGRESFVAYHRIPVQHGMTVGELARMICGESGLDLDLTVVMVTGWKRSDFFDRTGLLWVNPSPNMRSLTEAILYPGIGLLETTNLSVGRGTDTPFEVIGAPWLNPQPLARALNDAGLPGVRFVPLFFTPDASVFKDDRCGGICIMITDREEFRSLQTGLEIACQLRRLHSNDWKMKGYDRLLGNKVIWQAVHDGQSVDDIQAKYQEDLENFKARRAKWLLYK